VTTARAPRTGDGTAHEVTAGAGGNPTPDPVKSAPEPAVYRGGMHGGLPALTDKIMDLLMDTVCVVDGDGRYVYVSAGCADLLGYEPGELMGRRMIDLVHPGDRERTLAAAEQVMGGNPHRHFQNRYVRKDGQVVEIMWSARWSEEDGVRIAVARDVTEINHAARKQQIIYRISSAAQNSDGLSALFAEIHRCVNEIMAADRFFVALYDREHDMLSFPYYFDKREGSPKPIPLRAGTLVARVIREGNAVLAEDGEGGTCPVTEPSAARDGVRWLGAPLVSAGHVVGALVIQADAGTTTYGDAERDLLQFVSSQVASALDRKQSEARLRHMAHHDPLTDLPNRTLFQDRLDVALRRARRDTEHLALLYMDLRGFKAINDELGHAAGDAALREVARRLAGCLRDSDTVCRIGGDEFTVLVSNIRWGDNVDAIAAKIRDAIAEPLDVEGRSISLGVDIGTAIYPEDGEDAETLLRCADAGMYASKGAD